MVRIEEKTQEFIGLFVSPFVKNIIYKPTEQE